MAYRLTEIEKGESNRSEFVREVDGQYASLCAFSSILMIGRGVDGQHVFFFVCLLSTFWIEGQMWSERASTSGLGSFLVPGWAVWAALGPLGLLWLDLGRFRSLCGRPEAALRGSVGGPGSLLRHLEVVLGHSCRGQNRGNS